MDRQLSEWKLGVERIWSAAAPDYHEAARLVADIARASEETILRQAATQASPILRNASANNAGPITREAARRRLGVIRDVLHTLSTQQFGRRQIDPKPLAPGERYRQMLGLPIGRRLSGPEIHGPTSALPSACIRTPAATRGNSRSSPRRAMRGGGRGEHGGPPPPPGGGGWGGGGLSTN